MRDRISAALKHAEATQDETSLAALRLMVAAIRDRDAAMRADESVRGASDDAIRELLATMARQRADSARGYEEAGMLDLAERERAEAAVIEQFLPKPLTNVELDEAVSAAVAELGASSIKDVGKVMRLLKARHAGRLDIGVVGEKVRTALS